VAPWSFTSPRTRGKRHSRLRRPFQKNAEAKLRLCRVSHPGEGRGTPPVDRALSRRLLCSINSYPGWGESPSPQPSPRKSGARERTGSGASSRFKSQTAEPSLREAKRRSNPSRHVRKSGLLRGACHRARIRATRWLAMTKNPDVRSPSRREAPEALLESSAQRGRGECRMPVAPAASCALGIGRTHTSNNEYTGITRHSRTQWF
jgi:hypothetical protein